MKKNLIKLLEAFKLRGIWMIALLLPCIYGCNGGGGSSISGLSGGIGDIASSGGGVYSNPEPATMLLMGGGMMAMAYFKSRKK